MLVKLAVIIFLLVPMLVEAKLNCSDNGTKILYINHPDIGVSNTNDNLIKIGKVLNPVASQVDEKSKVKYQSIHYSNYEYSSAYYNLAIEGLRNSFPGQDPVKLYAYTKNGKKAYDYLEKYKKASAGGVFKSWTLGAIADAAMTTWTMYKADEKLGEIMRRSIPILNNFSYDSDEQFNQTVLETRVNIQQSLVAHENIIIVPSGHAGFVAAKAENQLRNDPLYALRFGRHVAEVPVGSYSSAKIVDPARIFPFKLDKDDIASVIGEPANYTLDRSTTGLLLENVFLNLYLNDNPNWTAYGKSSVESGDYGSAASIFKSKLISAGKSLPENCKITIASNDLICATGANQDGYFAAGGNIIAMHFTVSGFGTIQSTAGSECPLYASSDSNNPSGVACGYFLATSVHAKFVDDDGEVVYDKNIVNPCPVSGPVGQEIYTLPF